MHDIKFANEILLVIKEKLDNDMLSKNIIVNVRLSPFSHVAPERLKEAFGQIIEGESFKKVRLDIKPIEFELHCKSCGAVSKCSKVVFNCPSCKSSDFNIEKDKEFFVDSIDIG